METNNDDTLKVDIAQGYVFVVIYKDGTLDGNSPVLRVFNNVLEAMLFKKDIYRRF